MLSLWLPDNPDLKKGLTKMKTEKVDGDIKTFSGAALPAPLTYEGTFEAYETHAEVVAAKDEPSHDEVVAFRNTQRRNNKRQALMSEALEAASKAYLAAGGDKDKNPYVKPTLETSADLRYKTIFDALKAAGKSDEEAANTAKAALA